jgi:hypothetical protein
MVRALGVLPIQRRNDEQELQIIRWSARRLRVTDNLAFRARLALGSLRKDKMRTELCKEVESQLTQIAVWKLQLREGVDGDFGDNAALEAVGTGNYFGRRAHKSGLTERKRCLIAIANST